MVKNNRKVDDGTIGVEKSVEARENLMSSGGSDEKRVGNCREQAIDKPRSHRFILGERTPGGDVTERYAANNKFVSVTTKDCVTRSYCCVI